MNYNFPYYSNQYSQGINSPQPAPRPAPMPIPTPIGDPPDNQEGPPTGNDIGYMPNYLRKFIGKHVVAYFTVGDTPLVSKRGVLTAIGDNYLSLNEDATRDQIVADLYALKFMRVLNQVQKK